MTMTRNKKKHARSYGRYKDKKNNLRSYRCKKNYFFGESDLFQLYKPRGIKTTQNKAGWTTVAKMNLLYKVGDLKMRKAGDVREELSFLLEDYILRLLYQALWLAELEGEEKAEIITITSDHILGAFRSVHQNSCFLEDN